MEGVAVIKSGPNTEGAKQFVDYVSRKDVREAILRFAFRRPARDDLDLSKLPGAMPQLSSLKIVDYDEDAWVEKRVETMKKIQETIQRTGCALAAYRATRWPSVSRVPSSWCSSTATRRAGRTSSPAASCSASRSRARW